MSQAQFVTVTTTLAKVTQTNQLARAILGEHLAACVQSWPIRSLYRWQGQIESIHETVLACKTRARLAPALVTFIRAHHPYEVPEIIVTPILGGLPAYLAWISAETARASPHRQPRLTFPPPPTKKSPSRKGRKA